MKDKKHSEQIFLSHVMLVNIALNAATVRTARAWTKSLDETQWPETRDETYWAETETYCSETETRSERIGSRPRRWRFCPRRDRDETLVRLETVSRPRRLDRDRIPATALTLHVSSGTSDFQAQSLDLNGGGAL